MINSIEIKNLNKEFSLGRTYRQLFFHPFSKSKKLKVLNDINLDVKKGEICGLVGENGAGKTTLLKIIATLILPTSGKILVNNLDVEKNPEDVINDLGFVVSEERSFYWRLTGRQNLEFFAALNNVEKKQIKYIIEKVLDLLGLLKDADRPFKDYSSGMKQKLCVARGLLVDPDVVIMDEPTKGLDALAAANLRAFIKEEIARNKGKTVLWATNNINEIDKFCDRVTIVHKGRILATGTIDELKQRYDMPLNATMEETFIKAIKLD